ncbi:MAG: dienelactone hydrolase family protein [Anaerolineae bacterium]|uniref:dienelactone hydrolase family protein n=1 Tax=Promineifilum sp. TaxID=2664178 RepID=UPI001D63B116|nr:dienelactone hydrolase family protein [Anaerolineales bacterium]MCB8934311.1 dienelactone hydrolase family protein [Promineifilum sp.]MCO5179641.1 dienelactone hydrolase family protein [Promineifilum sp.]MCW5846768.1 dienelactone hydrolase family protein [Anaerolineae bacterium]
MTRRPDIELFADGRQTRGYLAVPSGSGPWPGVVVIQEWWGLNDNIRDIADRFASEGFAALAPDLYYGETAREPDDARKLAMGLQYPAALRVIQAAVDYLSNIATVSPKKIGLVGFCMGGGLAWHGAAKLEGIGAAVPCYGGGPEMTPEEAAGIRAPILAIYGELDQGVSPRVAQHRAALMDAAGVSQETIIYPGAQHAFMNDQRPAYHPEAAEDAWRRIVAHFRENLT